MSLAIPTMNGVNASNGMQGTTRNDSATFAGPPVAGPAGMAGPAGTTAVQPGGSSYTKGAGMSGGPLTPWHSGDDRLSATPGGAAALVKSGALSGGVVPGQGVASAVPTQGAQQMSQADMQDPNNAAMAGFQFAAGNDAAPSAATGAAQAGPDAPKVNPNYNPGGAGGGGAGTGGMVDSPFSYIQHLRPTNTSINGQITDPSIYLPKPLRSGNTSVNAGAPDVNQFIPPPLRPTDNSIQANVVNPMQYAPAPLALPSPQVQQANVINPMQYAPPAPAPAGPQVQSGKINNDWMNW